MNGANSNTSGDDVPIIDFVPKGESDSIRDERMEEIARRLIIKIARSIQGGVIFSPTEPDDKTKGWWQTDPQTGIPIGEVKRYDAKTGTWVAQVTNKGAYTPPKEKLVTRFVAAGDSTVDVAVGFNTANYMVSVVMRATPAPATYPTAMGWTITSKTAQSLVFDLKSMPAGGVTMEVYVRELEA